MKKCLIARSACLLMVAFSLPVFLNGCGEACEKTMTVTGTVTDKSNSQPLSGVNVFCCTAGETTPKLTTGSDGKYNFSTGKTGGFAGTKVRVEKAAYTTQYASAFTDDEASINRCGSYTVVRDVALSQ